MAQTTEMPEGYTKAALIDHMNGIGDTLDRLFDEVKQMEEGLKARRLAWSEFRDKYQDVHQRVYGRHALVYEERP